MERSLGSVNSTSKIDRRILYVAYLYPPIGGTGFAGAQRVTKFLRYLPCVQAHVLTAHIGCYPEFIALDNTQLTPVNGERVHRTGIIDPFQMLIAVKAAIKRRRAPSGPKPVVATQLVTNGASGKMQRAKDLLHDLFYFPDPAGPWIVPATIRGALIVRRHNLNVIFATGKPWSGLIVGFLISMMTGMPLVLDFRDPWIGNCFMSPKGRCLDALEKSLERRIIRRATLVLANTEDLRADFLRRFPDLPGDRFVTLPNGYDPADPRIAAVVSGRGSEPQYAAATNQLILTHAGFLYGGRDPAPLIQAIQSISGSAPDACRVTFRQIGATDLGYHFEERYAREISAGSVRIDPPMPYDRCLRELAESDILVNFQPDTATQIPSKLYDYLMLDRPILTIAGTSGALGDMIRNYGFGKLFAPQEVEGIAAFLASMVAQKQANGRLCAAYPQKERFNIERLSRQLSEILSTCGL
jgi:hypothetical protein